MNKKNNLIIILVAIIILAIVVVVAMKFGKKQIKEEPLNQTDIELNQAIKDDSTKAIKDSLNNINLDDTTSADDLNTIDQELNKL